MQTLLQKPANARRLCVLAHGAGAGMRHPFMETMTQLLAGRGLATLRYEFPYMNSGRRRPDPPEILKAAVTAAVAVAEAESGGLPLIAGGKSLGGRMTSLVAAGGGLPGVGGLVFLGFPLHAPGKPGVGRAGHLDVIEQPMLFVQGTRDSLADLDLITAVCKRLGGKATLHVVDGGDHSFKVLKRSGRDQGEVMTEIADTVADWTARSLGATS